jgi:hypothetical protein
MADGLMANPYAGLLNLGLSPEQAQAEVDRQRALQFANLNPQQRMAAGIYGGLTQVSRALGAKDPMLEQASQMRAMAQQFDTTTAQGLMQYAQSLQQMGNVQGAQMAAMQARQMMEQEAKTAKVRQEAVRGEEKNLREIRLREELAALPAEANDDQVREVVRRYGDPDKILKSIEDKEKAKLEREARAEAQRERQAFMQQQAEESRNLRRELAAASAAQRSALTGVQQQIAQERLDALQAKKQEAEDKKTTALKFEEAKARNVIGIVDNVLPKISGLNTAGFAGKALSLVPGSDAYDVAKNIETIKANLGFKELSDMRQASPTGGALGQVAVQELNFLQATVANLDVGQSPAQLRTNLDKIKKHYNRWLATTKGELPPEDKETAPAEGEKQKTVVRTGTVKSGPNAGKRVIEYSDGTREFQ